MLTKQEKLIRNLPDEEKKSAYMHEVLRLLYERGQTESAPALYETLNRMLFDAFETEEDYREIKKKFNALLLSREDALTQRIRRSADPIEACIRYVCAANYIDFAAIGEKEIVVIDFKTDKLTPEEIKEEYAPQLRTYRDVMQSFYPDHKIELYAWSFHNGTEVPVE
jgi:uncharacterized protein with ATP-grasp and redox domains